jgi:hypothetical protein
MNSTYQKKLAELKSEKLYTTYDMIEAKSKNYIWALVGVVIGAVLSTIVLHLAR